MWSEAVEPLDSALVPGTEKDETQQAIQIKTASFYILETEAEW